MKMVSVRKNGKRIDVGTLSWCSLDKTAWVEITETGRWGEGYKLIAGLNKAQATKLGKALLQAAKEIKS